MEFAERDWRRVYESNFRGKETLVGDFYRPLLSDAVNYDR